MKLLINLLSSASDSTTPSGGWESWLIWIIPIALIVVLMVFNSRQRKKQQKEVEDKMNNIKIGDRVKTIGLIYGTVVEIDRDNETFLLQTGTADKNSYILVDKMAIYQVIPELNNGDQTQLEEAQTKEQEVTEENSNN
ncbi:MAG: preprotein translocase subunit YajC [Clostridia bacterium]|nr:preprotein translocase subunit YajC [Clostridia bacterium]